MVEGVCASKSMTFWSEVIERRRVGRAQSLGNGCWCVRGMGWSVQYVRDAILGLDSIIFFKRLRFLVYYVYLLEFIFQPLHICRLYVHARNLYVLTVNRSVNKTVLLFNYVFSRNLDKTILLY